MIVGIGVDITDIERIRAVLERQGERFMRRVFTPLEQEYCTRHRDPAPHFAVRFAAKEAAFKALGTGWSQGVSWLDVEVRNESSGRPTIVLTGGAARMSARLGVHSARVSLSHSNTTAAAFVTFESER